MFTPRKLSASCLLILCLLSTALAQVEQAGKVERTITQSGSTVTASAAAERVRFTAPSNVVRMQLQVISESGQILFDISSKGNVLDWSLQDSSGQRLQGGYLMVVIVKNLSGRLSERIGSVLVGEKQVELQRVDATQLTSAQQQAIGPIEENAALTILKGDEAEAITVLSNNGSDGQIIRDRGALSFRLGDFFSGNDKEQMRLTEDGDLGIGTAKPKAKLDVAGMIRAREGFLFANGSALNINDKGALTLTNSDGSVVPNAAGTGTQNRVAKWTETGGSGTLGDSLISESGGNVVVGNAGQTGNIQIFGTATQDVFAGMGPDVNTGPAFNFGYAGGSFGRSAGFFNVRPDAGATPPNPSLRFATANVERMIVTNTGNVGIGIGTGGTPNSMLDVRGSISTSTQYNLSGYRVLGATGTNSLAVGIFAGESLLPTNKNNSFFGTFAGEATTTGSYNSFFGQEAGNLNTTGADNAFFGERAGKLNTLGSGNSFFGEDAGASNKVGQDNSFFGLQAGAGSKGHENSFFGTFAGSVNTTGNSNTAIGYLANFASPGVLTNATAIGYRAEVDQSNSLVLGSIKGFNGPSENTKVGIGTTTPSATLHVVSYTSSIGENTATFRDFAIGPNQSHIHYGLNGDWYIRSAASGGTVVLQDTAGNVGIGTASPDQKLTVNGEADKPGGGSWATFSDERLKNIKGRFTPGLKAVMQLQPVRYEYKPDNALGLQSSGLHIGFGAQTVQKIIPEAVSKNDQGYLLVNNDPILWTMLNAIKEQQKEIQDQHQQLQQKRAHIEKLEARLAALEMMVKKLSVKQRPRR